MEHFRNVARGVIYWLLFVDTPSLPSKAQKIAWM
jgi:hypothetical protein